MKFKVAFAILILVALLSVSFVSATSHVTQLEWSKTYYGENGRVAQTSDDGFAVAGTNASVGFYPAWERAPTLTKTDHTGVLQWNRTYEATGHISTNSIVQTQDGGYVLSGSAMEISDELKTKLLSGDLSDLLSSTWNPPYKGWLIKTDSQGSVEWSKTFELPFQNCHTIQTTDKNYVITGYMTNDLNGADGLLIKLDERGNTLWSKTFGGSSSKVFANGLLEADDNGYVVVGTWDDQGWLIKTDAEGNLQWSQTYSFDEPNRYLFTTFAKTSDSGYILAGGRLNNFCLVKTDSRGNMEWNHIYPTDSLSFSSVIQIAGRYYAASSNNRQAWIANFDSNGNLLDNFKYGNTGGNLSSFASSIIATKDGGFAVAGTLDRYTPTTPEGFQIIPSMGNNTWLAKFAPEPNVNPSPTVPELPSIATVILITLATTLTLIVLKRKLHTSN